METNMKNMESESFKDRLVGARKVSKIDVSKHEGKKVPIRQINEMRGKFGPLLVIETEPVETITSKEGVTINIRGSRMFSLSEDTKTGEIYWPEGGNLDLFLRKHSVSNPFELKGKVVMLVRNTNKDGKEFLTFN